MHGFYGGVIANFYASVRRIQNVSRDVKDWVPDRGQEVQVTFRRSVLMLDVCGYRDWRVIE